MFEMMDPYGEADVWAAFVPPVPPTDDDLVAADELDGWPGPDESEDGAGSDGYGAVSDLVLEEAAGSALAEFEQGLERVRLDGLDAEATLVEAAGVRRSERMVQARQLALAARWADLHAVLVGSSRVRGAERLVRLGGDGTPEVAEFAAAEYGAVQGLSDGAAKSLIGDALDLRHRFRRLWESVRAGRVDVWLARKTVQEARGLTQAAAGRVDARIAGIVGNVSWRRLRDIVAAAVLAADPAKAMDDAEQAAAGAGVFLDPEGTHGYRSMFIKANAGDVAAFEQAIELLSRAQKMLGDTRTPQQRRATAVGIIAHPQAAQDLIDRAEAVRQTQRKSAARRAADPDTADPEAADPRAGGDGRTGPQRPFRFGTSVLYVHLAHETLDAILAGQPFAAAGVVRVEDIGPVIADQVKQWLGHTSVVLKPVIDLPGIAPVDHYQTPPRIAEAIGLIRCADSWPHASCLSRHQDNDHTSPYLPMNRGGPPGQTNPMTMSRMTRTHHRLKTHAGWQVKQLRPGAWLYRSPHRYYFLVDQHGTTPLGTLQGD